MLEVQNIPNRLDDDEISDNDLSEEVSLKEAEPDQAPHKPAFPEPPPYMPEWPTYAPDPTSLMPDPTPQVPDLQYLPSEENHDRRKENHDRRKSDTELEKLKDKYDTLGERFEKMRDKYDNLLDSQEKLQNRFKEFEDNYDDLDEEYAYLAQDANLVEKNALDEEVIDAETDAHFAEEIESPVETQVEVIDEEGNEVKVEDEFEIEPEVELEIKPETELEVEDEKTSALPALFENLENLCGYLPDTKKRDFLSSLERLKMHYLMQKMSGGKGLLHTAGKLRTNAEVELKEVETLDSDSILLLFLDLQSLTTELRDQELGALLYEKLEEIKETCSQMW